MSLGRMSPSKSPSDAHEPPDVLDADGVGRQLSPSPQEALLDVSCSGLGRAFLEPLLKVKYG